MQISKLGYRKNEPYEIEAEKPTLLKELINSHINDLDYTKAELAKALKLNMAELQNMYFNEHSHIRIVKH